VSLCVCVCLMVWCHVVIVYVVNIKVMVIGVRIRIDRDGIEEKSSGALPFLFSAKACAARMLCNAILFQCYATLTSHFLVAVLCCAITRPLGT
jgi:hypothetical protein